MEHPRFPGVDYNETDQLSEVGATLTVYGSQRRLLVNANLSPAHKETALKYMEERIAELIPGEPALHVWLPED